MSKHSKRAHALLSASGASRWLNCTPSAKLEDEYGERKSSPYAEEGTLAHELAEAYLRKDVLQLSSDSEFEAELERVMSHKLFNEEMLDCVPIYTDYCEAEYIAAKETSSLAIIEIEQRLDLTEFIPDSFGTADCVIIKDDVMQVIDLKYGKGVPVYADWNKQLMLYGLGALRKYDTMYDISEIVLTIVQPRLNNISSWQISVSDLLEWAHSELKPKADMAFAGEGELSPGEWCKFCAVKNKCRKLYEQQMEIAKYEFADPVFLSDEEIADIVLKAPKFAEWANSIQEYAQEKAVTEQKQWPGLKLVEGVSRRKWAAEDDMISSALFTRVPELSEEDIFDMKLKSITAIEKLIGKKRFGEQFDDLTIKPQGKPQLVPLNDKRPAMGNDQAKLDFSEQ